jgi:hypothetical protein
MSPSDEQVPPELVQRPPWQLPEQHWPFDVHRLPRVEQPLLSAAHALPTQLLLQHSPFEVQAWATDLHTPAPHLPFTQAPLQHAVEIVQALPAVVHEP